MTVLYILCVFWFAKLVKVTQATEIVMIHMIDQKNIDQSPIYINEEFVLILRRLQNCTARHDWPAIQVKKIAGHLNITWQTAK